MHPVKRMGGVALFMDGKSRRMADVEIERLWCSLNDPPGGPARLEWGSTILGVLTSVCTASQMIYIGEDPRQELIKSAA